MESAVVSFALKFIEAIKMTAVVTVTVQYLLKK